MERSICKRVLSGLLAMLLVFTSVPLSALAVEDTGLCEHHTVHIDCGYAEAVEGSECTHEHGEDCYEEVTVCTHIHEDCGYVAGEEAIPCDHVHGDCGYAEAVEGTDCDHVCGDECAEGCIHTCDDGTCAFSEGIPGSDCTHLCGDGSCSYFEGSEEIPCGHVCSWEEGCITKQLNCRHIHDESCGYAEAVEAQPCGFECAECAAEAEAAAALEAVKAQIAALPTVEQLQELSYEEQMEYYPLLEEAYEAYNALSEEQKAEFPDAQESFDVLFAYFATLKKSDLAITRQPEAVSNAIGQRVEVSVEATGEGLTYQWYAARKGTEEFLSVEGASDSTYSFVLGRASDGLKLYCVVTDAAGNAVTSETVEITVSGAGEVLYCAKVNPSYEGFVSEEDLVPHTPAVAAVDDYKDFATYHTSASAAGKYIKPYLLDRIETVTFGFVIPETSSYYDDVWAVVDDVLNAAYVHTGVPNEGDYLNRSNIGWSGSLSVNDYNSGNYYVEYSLTMSHLTTAAMEEVMDQRVDELLAELNPTGSDYNKVKAVYSWICENIRYDYANLEDESYTLKYSAYAGLINHTCVCQGYASLLYRLCLEMGIDARYIRGYAGGGNHGWNIVRIGSLYYNADSTWDEGQPTFSWFLLNDANFVNHTRRDEYLTSDFYAKYPMGQYNYDPNSAVKITKQPTSVTVANGATASVSVTASGSGLSYQWYYANSGSSSFTAASGYTSSTYSVTMSSSVNGRRVYCKITDKYGNTVTSNTVTLNMQASELKITSQPVSVTVASGATASVSVTATGTGLTYQWYYANAGSSSFTAASGYTSSTYSVTMSSSVNGRRVYCVVKDSSGNSVTSNTATLNMQSTLKITSQPVGVTVGNGETATVSVTASGTGLTYQWYYASAGSSSFYAASGYTSSSYSVTMNSSVNGRQVYCVIKDSYGNSVTSNTVTLSMYTELTITQQPQSVTVAEGATATVTVKASGDGLTYKWYYADAGSSDFIYTSTFSGSSYYVEMNSSRDGRRVYCVISDKYGNSVTSDIATLSMRTTLRITQQPVSVLVAEGEMAIVTLEAVGEGLIYQWYFAEAGSDEFIYTSTFTDNSYYVDMNSSRNGRRVYCVVKDMYGNSVTSNIVTLSMMTTLRITKQPVSVRVAQGAMATVSVKAVGDGLSYYWYFAEAGTSDFIYTSSFTGSSYSVQMNSARDGRQVYVVIKDKYGNSVISDVVVLSMQTPLVITQQPQSVKVAEGDYAMVTVEAQGEGQLSYKWYFAEKGSSEFIYTSSFQDNSYFVEMNSARNGRRVYCVVSDQYGNSVTSDTATLSMQIPLKITKQPVSVKVAEGAMATVSVRAQGEGLTYKWYFAEAGTNDFIYTSSFTGSSYSVEMNSYRNGRQVYCEISDQYGYSVMSDIVMLTMRTPLKITQQPQSVKVLEGETAMVTLSANGDGLIYHWYFAEKGSDEFIYTSSFQDNSYYVEMTNARNGRRVYCVVKDEYGNSVTSNTVTIGMKTPLKIIEQPQPVRVDEGAMAVVTVRAQGDGLTYKWYFCDEYNSNDFIYTSSFSGSSYSVAMTNARNGRRVYCEITDEYGDSVTTNIVMLSMRKPLQIVSQPESVRVLEGETAAAYVYATGDGLKYKWYFAEPGTDEFIYTSSFTGATYSVEMNSYRNGRRVYCVVTDAYGKSLTTNTVTLSMKTPLQIVSQPASVLVTEGEMAVVSVRAKGDGLTYKWYFAEAGSEEFIYTSSFTGSSYSVSMDKYRNGRRVYCVITDEYGDSVTSDIATLSMKTILKITQQPVSVRVLKGETASVSVTAKGDGLSYKWYFAEAGSDNFILTSSFKGNSYFVEMNAARNGRRVYCVITDEYGNSVTTNTVTLSMKTPLAITRQPESVSVLNGEMATVSFEAVGDGLTCKWYFAEADSDEFIYTSSFVGTSYSVEMNSYRDGRRVYCVITDEYGDSVTTDTVTLLMKTPLKITKQPVSVKVAEGEMAVISVRAQGDDLVYEWYFAESGTDKFIYTSSFKGSSYSVEMNNSRNGRRVYCKIKDKYGDYVISDTVTLSMKTTLTITQQPVSVRVLKGEMATVKFEAKGDGLSCKWYFAEAGDEAFTYTSSFVSNVYSVEMNSSRNGRRVYCVITDEYGNSVTTDTVTLSMKTPLQITKQPVSVKAADGEMAVVSFRAQGDGLTYEWYFAEAGSDKFIYTSSFKGTSYSVEMNESRNGRRVYCLVKDAYGDSVRTDTVLLSMKTPLQITKQPVSVSVLDGAKATVTVGVQGDGLTYKWYFADAGSDTFVYTSSFTGSSYFVSMNSTRNGRRVYCVITDEYGNSVTTDTVTLKMKTPLKITKQPVSVVVAEGETAVVSFRAQGDGLTYKWYYADVGSTNFNLTSTFKGASYSAVINSTRNGRRIYCVVTDEYGDSVQTDTVTLSMRTTLKITQQPVSVKVAAGEMATVSLEAQGDGLTYKWYFAEAGSDTFVYTSSFTGNSYFVSMNSTRNGRRVYCVVKDEYGNSVTSDTVTLSMQVPVKITKQPVSVKVAEGANATVSVRAEGDGLTYAWYFSEAGSTKFSLTTSFVGSSYSVAMNSYRNGRRVYCVVTDQYGNSVTSDTVTLSMEIKAAITKQPVSVKVASGKYATVTVGAKGDGLTYAWYFAEAGKDTFTLTSSFKDNTYSVEMNSYRNGRRVYCVVTDQYGNSVTSDTVTLSMQTVLKITKQPVSVTVPSGSMAIASVRAQGDGLTYAWYFAESGKDTFTLTNSFKGSSYSVEMNSYRNGRRVYCVITDEYGNSVTSDTVTLSMQNKVVAKILNQTSQLTGDIGDEVWFKIEAEGDGLTYEWYYKNASHTQFYLTTSVTGDTYSIELSEARAGRSVYCVVTDQYGNSVTSDTVTFAKKTPLKITRQPGSVIAAEGANVVISVIAQGDGLTYKWYFANKGATSFSYTSTFKGSSYTTQMSEARNGRRVYCVITDQYGNSVTTNTVTMTMK